MVYKYNKTQNPPIQTSSGLPIYRITSIGTVGTVSKRLVVEAVRSISLQPAGLRRLRHQHQVHEGRRGLRLQPLRADALSHGVVVTNPEQGAANVAGDRYRGPSGNALSYGTFVKTGPSLDYGVPPVVSGAAGFYNGPWEIFGMTQAQFFALGRRPGRQARCSSTVSITSTTMPRAQNQSCNISYAGAITGSGILYVDGDLTLNNNFHFKGLVYCEGDITASNSAWILGALIAERPNWQPEQHDRSNTFLLSSDAIANLPGAPAAGLR